MKKLNHLIAALVLTAFVACQKDTTPVSSSGVRLTDTLSIKIGETVTFGDFKITVDSILDARCARDLTCITAGFAATKLTVQEGNSIQVTRLTTVEPTNTMTVFTRRFHLLDVTPYPYSYVRYAASGNAIKLLVR